MNEQRDSRAGGRHEKSHEQLPRELRSWTQFEFVIENTDDQHSQSTQKNSRQFEFTPRKAVLQPANRLSVHWLDDDADVRRGPRLERKLTRLLHPGLVPDEDQAD